jgi:iron complex transport system permease protein
MADAVQISSSPDRKLPNYRFRFILLILAVMVCIVGSFAVGRYSLSISDVVLVFLSSFFSVTDSVLRDHDAFFSLFFSFYPLTVVVEMLSVFLAGVFDPLSLIFPSPGTWDFAIYSVLFNIRLPRICAAIFVGAALSTAGAAYQGMFQNPLVSPDILGASTGAGFGAALAIYWDLGSCMITMFAFVGGLIAVGFAYLISRLTRGSVTLSMVLSGILIGGLFSAATSYIKLVADTDDQLPAITYWLMGSLAGATMDDVIFVGIVISTCFVPLYLLRWRMNVLTLGEDEARSMGVNTNFLRFVVIICATLITAVAVSISGIIGWVGLVIPHFCRMIFGYDYRRIIPAAAVMGAGFLLLVDDFSRTIAITEIPLGILTAFVGAPIFAYLLIMGGKRS